MAAVSFASSIAWYHVAEDALTNPHPWPIHAYPTDHELMPLFGRLQSMAPSFRSVALLVDLACLPIGCKQDA